MLPDANSIMYLKDQKCDNRCFKPAGRRLALFGAKDDYECYAESYIKCFWGLCDHHKSIDSFAKTADCKVITQQPGRQDIPIRPTGVIQSILVCN